MIDLHVEPHRFLRVNVFTTDLPAQLAQLPSPSWLTDLLRSDAHVPIQKSEELRTAIRDMLRYGGYKPTGRGKPASEYLVRTAEEGGIRSINLAVDACNVVSLHSGFPISVVDMDLAEQPFRIAIAPAGTAYVFNPTGQEIDVSGLVCLHDARGACGNAVKDSQRTKTRDETTRTLSVIWGAQGFEQELEAAYAWYAELLQRASATVLRIAC
jgi:DNA/RNA-binding domain of Phe-tRNA-synthetase-like protein